MTIAPQGRVLEYLAAPGDLRYRSHLSARRGFWGIKASAFVNVNWSIYIPHV